MQDYSVTSDPLLRGLPTRGEAVRIGNVLVTSKLGSGGMGAVYLGRDTKLNIDVAVKVLPFHLAASSPVLVERFVREAQTAAVIDHPNLLRVYTVDEDHGVNYIVMEFVDGESAADRFSREGPLPEADALDICAAAGEALAAAHAEGIIHRDVKPANIMIRYKDGRVKLADLGLAKTFELHDDSTGAMGLTATGQAMGTPAYMSPEQAQDASKVDPRTDVYSLGATLYTLVTGRAPHKANQFAALILKLVNEEPTDPKEIRPDLSDATRDVITGMMAKRPENRTASMAEVVEVMKAARAGQGGLEETLARPQLAGAATIAPGDAPTLEAPTPRRLLREADRARTISTVPLPRAGVSLKVVIILLCAVLGAGVLASVVTVALVGRSQQEGAPVESLPVPTPEQVQAACEEVRGLIEGGEFERAITRASELAAKLAGGPGAEKLDGLKADASRRLDEKRRLEAEESEKQRRCQSFVGEAKKALDAEDYTAALSFLAQAKAIEETEEVSQLVQRARRLQFIARAKESERKGDRAAAIDLYGRALEMAENQELRQHVEEIKRQKRLDEFTARGDELAREGKWEEARASYVEALKLARADEKKRVEEKVGAAEREIRYAEAIGRARDASQKEAWKETISHAQAALAEKPGDKAAQAIVDQAKRALAPKPEVTNSIGMKLVLVPAGEFVMGSSEGADDEAPPHRVHLGSFYMSKHEVTNAQYALFDPAHRDKWKGLSLADNEPVVCLTWNEANAFCEWLSKKEGVTYRLPTEAEWEYAARGTDGRLYPWGNGPPTAHHANLAGNADGFDGLAPAGSFPDGATREGIMDLIGNAAEWCSDWYGRYSPGVQRDPTGPETGTKRVVRGSAFAYDTKTWSRASARGVCSPDARKDTIGFRVVRELTEDERMATNE